MWQVLTGTPGCAAAAAAAQRLKAGPCGGLAWWGGSTLHQALPVLANSLCMSGEVCRQSQGQYTARAEAKSGVLRCAWQAGLKAALLPHQAATWHSSCSSVPRSFSAPSTTLLLSSMRALCLRRQCTRPTASPLLLTQHLDRFTCMSWWQLSAHRHAACSSKHASWGGPPGPTCSSRSRATAA